MMLSLEKVYNVRKGGTLVNKKQIAIVVDDYLRYYIFNEEKPHYKFL